MASALWNWCVAPFCYIRIISNLVWEECMGNIKLMAIVFRLSITAILLSTTCFLWPVDSTAAGERRSVTTTANQADADLRAAVERFITAVDRGDTAAVGAIYTPDFLNVRVADDGGYAGRRGAANLDPEARPGQIGADHLGQALVVVDDQDFAGHMRLCGRKMRRPRRDGESGGRRGCHGAPTCVRGDGGP